MKKFICIGIALVIIMCSLASVSCSAKSTITENAMDGESYPRFTSTPAVTKTSVPQISAGYTPAYSGYTDSSSDIQRMIVRTANMTLVVSDIADTLDKISRLAEDSKGYVVSSQQWKDNGRLLGTITIRVPSGDFDNTMSVLRGMSDEVTSENTSSQDVTEEYVDLTAQLKNLESTENQLLEIMKKAEKVEDILAVQKQLTSTRDEIERIKGRMQYLQQTSQTSLITVSLTQSKLDVELTAISGRNVTGGNNVYFNVEIAGGFAPYSYKWDFGDGSTSTDESPVHSYNSTGKFSVSVTVTDDKGNTAADIRNNYITVQSGWNVGNVAKTAWKGLSVFFRALVNVIIWIGIFSPVWIIIGIVIFMIIRRRKIKGAKIS